MFPDSSTAANAVFHAVYGVSQPAVFEPLQGEFVIFEARAFLHIRQHEFFVFFGKLLRRGILQRARSIYKDKARGVDVFEKSDSCVRFCHIVRTSYVSMKVCAASGMPPTK
ncbi:MAG: hypothetical protein ACTTJV_03705 [Ottowia sp.]